MDVITAIMTRRSIRKYSDEYVSDDLVKKLLEAAMQAPSAGNQQPWQFIVIRDKHIFKLIQKFHPFSSMLDEASVAILVCGDIYPERYKNYWIIDCSNAAENILLAAHALGLGAVWLGVHPREERTEPMRELFKLPENIKPHSLIVIGYPAESKETEYRFNPEKIHHEKW
ncbi:MAG: nitroreductase family protein [bacterium]